MKRVAGLETENESPARLNTGDVCNTALCSISTTSITETTTALQPLGYKIKDASRGRQRLERCWCELQKGVHNTGSRCYQTKAASAEKKAEEIYQRRINGLLANLWRPGIISCKQQWLWLQLNEKKLSKKMRETCPPPAKPFVSSVFSLTAKASCFSPITLI